MGPGSCRHPPGGGDSQSTVREGGTGKASSSRRRRLAVHREGGWDRGGVILRAAEARGPPGGRVGQGRRHPPGGVGSQSTGRGRVGPGRRHPPGGGGTRSTGREGGTGEASSSGRRRLAVHQEGGCNRGGVVILRAAEAHGPP